MTSVYRLVFFLIAFVCCSATAQAEDKILGLIELAPLCATPCPGSEKPIGLYPAPYVENPTHVLSRDLFIEGNPPWQNRESPLWPESKDIEANKAAAIVFERVGNIAYKIKIAGVDYWVKKHETGEFHPYPQLLQGRLAYLPNWNFWLSDLPGKAPRFVDKPTPHKSNEAIPVRVTAIQKVHGVTWTQIEILKKSPCQRRIDNILAKGWIEAYDTKNQPAIWLEPQGCR